MEKNPLVSVVVITYNEENQIRECIKSIKNSSYKNIEIILVDGDSKDKTLDIANNFSDIKIFKTHKKGMSFQRNYGFNKSKGKYVYSFDADMRMHKKLIENCVDICERDNEIVALYIPEIILGNSFFNKVRRFERTFYNGTVIDSVRFFKKDVVKEIGFFDEKISGTGEDWDIDKRIRMKGKTKISDFPLYHNEINMNLKNYLERKKRYTPIMNNYINKWGKNDFDIKKQIGISYRYFFVFIENGKWKKVLRHPFLMINVLFLKILVGISFVLGGGLKYKK